MCHGTYVEDRAAFGNTLVFLYHVGPRVIRHGGKHLKPTWPSHCLQSGASLCATDTK